MNKQELVTAINEKDEQLTKTAIARVINLLEEVAVETIEGGEGIQLIGFLNIAPVARAARKGYNPQTGEELEIEPKMAVKVDAGKRLKDAAKKLDIKKFVKAKETEKKAKEKASKKK